MKKRILIFIVAYNAEKHIEKVLDRIPSTIFESYDCEILIIDDQSKDDTFVKSLKYKGVNSEVKLNVFYNPENQGYGGNQKLGYHYAINNNFDAVVLLHGDGQYAPELLEEMILPIIAKGADAVFGSRMLKSGGALKGGMPYYKYVGNKILTYFQNKLLGSNLSEFHSGYRAYSVNALSQIPFERNSGDFHFDTQIIIQLLLAKKQIVEIPIPTYYGDEICHVNGIKYAKDVAVTTTLSKIQKLDILYRSEYDISVEPNPYAGKLNYYSSHTLAIDCVEANKKVIDIGCNTGYVSKELRKKGCEITGVDKMMLKDENKAIFNQYYQLDLNEPSKLPSLENYDYILLLDVISQIERPEFLLDTIRKSCGLGRPKLILTTANIGFLPVRLRLFLGFFNYGKRGILDLRNKRLFTFYSMKKTLIQSGYKIKEVKGIPAPLPKAFGDNMISRFLLMMNRVLIFFSKGIFSYQIYIEAEPLPILDAVLDRTIKHSRKKAEENQIEYSV